MDGSTERLYELLPVVYREEDAARGYPLRALLRILGSEVEVVEDDIRQLYDDMFIETCRQWVIPYIGDLVSNRLLYDRSRQARHGTADELFDDLTGPDLRPPIAIRTRADVAKTIYYRRRKGTLAMLEELARDVTGWPAHAVEFFELLGWHQHLEHFRPQSAWADLRTVDRIDRVDGPFDVLSHTVDVRRIAPLEGWHAIDNVGFFLFRLGAFELERVPARQASVGWGYHFSPLGNPAPLFSRWRREGDEAGLATELHVPAPIRRAFFFEDLQDYRAEPPVRRDFTRLYGLPDPIPGDPTEVHPDASFCVIRNGTVVVPAMDPSVPSTTFAPRVKCRNLDPWPAAQPVGEVVAIDVATGRLAIGDGWPDATEAVEVFYHYGFPAALGGGPYERHQWLVRPDLARVQLFVEADAVPSPDTFTSVTDALTDWIARGRPDALITVRDSRTYALPATLELPNEGFLVIEAANGVRPLFQTAAGGLDVQSLPPANPADPDRSGSLTLSGVVVEGHLSVTGDLGRLRLLHATLVPGRRLTEDGDPEAVQPSLVVEPGLPGDELNAQLRVEAAFSVLGAIAVPEHADGVTLLDCIVDGLADDAQVYAAPGGGPGPDLLVERSTLVGRVECRSLGLSESIVTGNITTVRTQEGCVRFSYVRPGSHTPRRYRCQPDLASEQAIEEALHRNAALTAAEQSLVRAFVEGWLVPAFVAQCYGQPPYMQLRLNSPEEIRRGAEDGSEMGVYSHVKEPQRLDNLRLRLEEYLPFGLEAGALFAT